ncbi:MAG: retroviral-like aspartic protease family protein [Bacteroidetes bacterium]|nr:retroviral-like aspartic protease family protein [Bacteroidota bacterium]
MKEPFNLVKKKIIVVPTIKGLKGYQDFNFIVDTGASVSIINETAAVFLGFDLKRLKTENLTTVSGRASAKILKLPKIELFGKSVINFEVKVVSLPTQVTLLADGLIGMDFLLYFKEFTINFEEKTIEI